jgi:hypothetical protein
VEAKGSETAKGTFESGVFNLKIVAAEMGIAD